MKRIILIMVVMLSNLICADNITNNNSIRVKITIDSKEVEGGSKRKSNVLENISLNFIPKDTIKIPFKIYTEEEMYEKSLEIAGQTYFGLWFFNERILKIYIHNKKQGLLYSEFKKLIKMNVNLYKKGNSVPLYSLDNTQIEYELSLNAETAGEIRFLQYMIDADTLDLGEYYLALQISIREDYFDAITIQAKMYEL